MAGGKVVKPVMGVCVCVQEEGERGGAHQYPFSHIYIYIYIYMWSLLSRTTTKYIFKDFEFPTLGSSCREIKCSDKCETRKIIFKERCETRTNSNNICFHHPLSFLLLFVFNSHSVFQEVCAKNRGGSQNILFCTYRECESEAGAIYCNNLSDDSNDSDEND